MGPHDAGAEGPDAVYGVSFGQQVNSPGPFAGTLAITDPDVAALDWQDATLTGRTLLGVEYLGELIWGGILWTNDWDDSAAGMPLPVSGAEMGSYFAARLQALDYSVEWTDLTETNATVYGTTTVDLSSLTADPDMIGHRVEDNAGGMIIARERPCGRGRGLDQVR